MRACQFERPAIEDLMRELSEEYSIIIVTHNMQQAARVSIFAAFLMAKQDRIGHLVEYGENRKTFTNAQDERAEAHFTRAIRLTTPG